MVSRLQYPLAIGIVYLSVIFLGRLPDHLILFPSTARMDATSDSQNYPVSKRLSGNLDGEIETSRSRGSPGYLCFALLRKMRDRAEHWVEAEAEAWNGRAVEVWGMNYPGFGGSTGTCATRSSGPGGTHSI